MNYPLTPEQVALLRLAQTTWARREAVKQHNLPFGEESITETILMDLAMAYPGRMSILPFNKRQEGENGADWAWAFASSDGSHVLPMLVQAKLLDIKDFEYPELGRAVGKRTPPVLQIDQLLKAANRHRWPALYAFYNHLSDPSRIPSVCRSLPRNGLGMHESWGITIALASHVRAAMNDYTFDTHREHSVPLHCLLCSSATGERPSSGSAGLALGRLKKMRDFISTDVTQLAEPFLPEKPLDRMPELFLEADRILELHGQERDYRLDRLAEENPDIAGVVTFRDAAWPRPHSAFE
jgi:hypothetical protein